METLHLLGALLISLLSLTLQPPSPPPPPILISVASKTKKCWELKQSTLKGGEGRESGNGLNSRYGGHWELEKVFFNESVSTILQLVVVKSDAFNTSISKTSCFKYKKNKPHSVLWLATSGIYTAWTA